MVAAAAEDTPTGLRTHRILLGAGAAIYLLWWALVELMLPGSFNPLSGRLAVVSLFALALAATYRIDWVARNVQLVYSACAWVLTAHYVYLVRMNAGGPAWWGGLLITIAAVAACIQTQRALVAYSAFALGLAILEAVLSGQLAHSVFPPGVATVLFLSNMTLRSRLRAEHEQTMAAELRRARDRAEEVSRFKTMFLGLVSHELLTPIQALQMGVQALARYPDASAGQRAERAASMARSLSRLRELIESLLDYVQLEAGRLKIVEQEIDVAAIIAEAVEELQPSARAKKLELSFVAESKVPPATSDPRLLRLVVTNLLTNALKYTEQGSVSADLAHTDAGHRIVVRDTGVGIAAADQVRMFEPFTQLEPLEHKHARGVGLGLALVQQVVQKLGAKLEVSSDVGHGSAFTVTLPARQEERRETNGRPLPSAPRAEDDTRAPLA